VAAACLIGVTSLGFTTIYAYKSDDITAFTGLYPIKQTVENITLALTSNPLEKAEIYLDLAAKRTREIAKQLETNQKIDPNTLVAIKDNTNQALKVAQQITDRDSKKAIEKKIVAASHAQVSTLKEVKAASVKIVAQAKDIPLAEIATQDISLGTGEIPTSIARPIEDIRLDTVPTSSDTLIASTPEISLLDSIINDSKEFADENVVAAKLANEDKPTVEKKTGSASGATLPDQTSESVSLSQKLP